MAVEDREPFLARWSRLKKSEATRPTPPAAPPQPSPPGPVPQPADALEGTEAASEDTARLDDLPRLEDLTSDSDISIFLRKGVPDELRNLALRRAWSLDPAIRDFVEVAENQYDWNAPGGVPGFGELDPSFDLEKLLAQATGQLPDPGPVPVEVARQNDAPAPSVSEPSAVQQSMVHEVSPGSATEGGAAEPPEETRIPVSPARRRHGGALPS